MLANWTGERLHRKQLKESIITANIEIRLFESDQTPPPGCYIGLRVFLFDNWEMVWTDETTKGIETIEPGAISNDQLNNSDFTIGFEFSEKVVSLVRIANGEGAACKVESKSLYFIFKVPDTLEGYSVIEVIRNGWCKSCKVQFATYYENRDFVRFSRMKDGAKTAFVFNVIKVAEITSLLLQAKEGYFDITPLREYCKKQRPIYRLKVYGLDHFERVAQNGEKLYIPGANPYVIHAFAYLHDLERNDNVKDPGHGERTAKLIDRIRGKYLTDFSDVEIQLLKDACRLHETTTQTGNRTIDICLDADRLDLPRLGIYPDPDTMATGKGALLAAELSRNK